MHVRTAWGVCTWTIKLSSYVMCHIAIQEANEIPMYLRLIWDQMPDDARDERLAIETAFLNSPFRLEASPEKHPRGGFSIHVDCSAADFDEIAKLLQDNNLLAII